MKRGTLTNRSGQGSLASVIASYSTICMSAQAFMLKTLANPAAKSSPRAITSLIIYQNLFSREFIQAGHLVVLTIQAGRASYFGDVGEDASISPVLVVTVGVPLQGRTFSITMFPCFELHDTSLISSSGRSSSSSRSSR